MLPLNRLAYLSCSGESWFVYVTSLPCTCPHVQYIYVLVVCYIFGTHVTGTDTISQSVESYFTVVNHVGLAQAYPKRAIYSCGFVLNCYYINKLTVLGKQ